MEFLLNVSVPLCNPGPVMMKLKKKNKSNDLVTLQEFMLIRKRIKTEYTFELKDQTV